MAGSQTAKRARPPRVGDRVRIQFGEGKTPATVIEDRGVIGAQGRHLYRVRLDSDNDEPGLEIEVPTQEISP